MRYFFQAVSWLFFPGMSAVLGFALVFELEDKDIAFHLLALPITVYVLAPILIAIGLKMTGVVSDLMISMRKERNISYPVGLGLASLFLALSANESWLYKRWIMAGMAGLVLLWVLNAFWMKASAHMAACSGLFVLTLVGYTRTGEVHFVIYSAVLCALVYLSRKGLSAHSHIELLTGFCLGFIATFALFRI